MLVQNINSKEWNDIKNLPNEEWRDVYGYEGLYKVSNYGRIKSLKKLIRRDYKHNKQANVWKDDCILRRTYTKYGYTRITLTKDKIHKSYHIHRLVAMSFIPNLDNKPYINHKNEIKDDNRVQNLEWCTPKYNSNYGSCRLKISKKKQENPHNIKAVFQYDKNGKFIAEYNSAANASRILGIPNKISEACKLKHITCGGFLWRAMDDGYIANQNIKPFINNRLKKVIQMDMDGNEIDTYTSIANAARATKIPYTSIVNSCIKGHLAYGYKFRYL